MPIPVDLRLDPRWIVPVEPAGVLEQHVLLIDDGRIVALVPTATAERDYVARERVALPTHVLLPGLVNASHARGHDPAARHRRRRARSRRGWSSTSGRSRRVSSHRSSCTTARSSPPAKCCSGGVTCCADQYFFPDAAARAYRQSGMRALLGLPVLDFPTPYAADAQAYLQAGLAVRDAWKHEPRLVFALAPHAPYTVERCELGKNRRLCAATRSADPDTPAGNARRARSEPAESRHEPACPARSSWRHGIEFHRRARGAPARFGHRSACHPGLPGGALSDVEPEARQRPRTGGAHCRRVASMSRWAATAQQATTASTCSRRCASPRCWPRSSPAMQRRCPPQARCAWQRSAGQPRSASTRTSARCEPGKQADAIAVNLAAFAASALLRPASRTWCMSPGATR